MPHGPRWEFSREGVCAPSAHENGGGAPSDRTGEGDRSADRAASRCRDRNHAHRRPPARPRLSIGPAHRCRNRKKPRDPAYAHSRRDDPSGDETVPADLLEEARRFGALGREARKVPRRDGDRFERSFPGTRAQGPARYGGAAEAPRDTSRGHHGADGPPGPGAGGGLAFSAFSSPDRERELEALLDPRFRLALDRAGVVLVSFREIFS